MLKTVPYFFEVIYFSILLLFTNDVLYRNKTSCLLKSTNSPSIVELTYLKSIRVILLYSEINRGVRLLAKESLKIISSFPELIFGFSIWIKGVAP